MYRIAVLASTNGTDLQAIIDGLRSGLLPGVELAGVLSNKAECFAVQRARLAGYSTFAFDAAGKSREEFDAELLAVLEELKVDLVVLVGYMRILSPLFIAAFPEKIINVHPSLLPAFSGPGAIDGNVHEAVLNFGAKVTGCTIHLVNEEVDAGPILLQKACEVEPGETPDSLKEKVQLLEKEWYPKVILAFAEGRIEEDAQGHFWLSEKK
ncbi:phosphoribosylglycinamide formyltransferase [Candidatus Peregrinibacteria bacterium CG_4_9_14_0_2_um_filter_53_11]|nr:MAG: phosphoribosylglycinamide formyltransferase [Candidatus Peregrinibacteria bacterium CG_4_9_14_0_2_um_filter_53_11]